MLLLFILSLFFYILPAHATDNNPIDKKAFVRDLINKIPKHPDLGSFSDAPVEQTDIFFSQFPNEFCQLVETLETHTLNDRTRTLSSEYIDTVIKQIQNQELCEKTVREQLTRAALCFSEYIEYFDQKPSLETIENPLSNESSLFKQLNADALNEHKNKITLTNQLLYVLNNPDETTDIIINRFFLNIGDLNPFGAQDIFDNTKQKLESIKEMLSLVSFLNTSTIARITYIFSLSNPVHKPINKKRVREDKGPTNLFYVDPDLAKITALMRYCNPKNQSGAERARTTVNLIKWRYDLFHDMQA